MGQGSMSDLDKVIAKLRADLAWRGPTGRTAGVIVLNREQAEIVLKALEEQEPLRTVVRDLLDCLDKPTNEVSPSWIIGACQRARALVT
jgi:hypothetical protein